MHEIPVEKAGISSFKHIIYQGFINSEMIEILQRKSRCTQCAGVSVTCLNNGR